MRKPDRASRKALNCEGLKIQCREASPKGTCIFAVCMQIEDVAVFDAFNEPDGNVDKGLFQHDEESIVGEGDDSIGRPAEELNALSV